MKDASKAASSETTESSFTEEDLGVAAVRGVFGASSWISSSLLSISVTVRCQKQYHEGSNSP